MTPSPRKPAHRAAGRRLKPLQLLVAGGIIAGLLLATGQHVQNAQAAEQSALITTSTVSQATGSDASLPASVDLSQWAVPAGMQGTVGACVSWAVGYNIMGWYANKMGSPTRFAPMYLYSQTHIDGSPDGGGSLVRDANIIANTQGVAPAVNYQQGDYDFASKPTDAEIASASPYKMQPAVPLYGASVYSKVPLQQIIERALADGTPVGVMIPLYPKFYTLDKTNAVFSAADATGATSGLHYMAVFGYDSQGIWVQNSWGAEWGSNGFARLTWDFVSAHVIEAEAYPGFIASALPQVAVPAPTTKPTPTTAAPTPVAKPLPALPKAVRNLHTVKRGKTTVRVSWQAPATISTIYAYWVVVSSQRYGEHQRFNLAGKVHSVTIKKLHRGTTYRVQVQAINARGLSKTPAYLNVKGLAKR